MDPRFSPDPWAHPSAPQPQVPFRDPMQGGPTPPVADPAADARYQEWRARLPKPLQYEGDYDLRGFYNKNPNFRADQPNQHLTDEFKLPNHETFSNESRYADARHPGGSWNGEAFSPAPPASRGFDPGGHGGDPEQARAQAYATISANPASEEAHAAREVLARLPKINVTRPQPGSQEEPSHLDLLARYMTGMR